MELYSSNESYKLYQGNMLDMLDIIEKESIDSIVTDPPYELNFMSKGWDNAGISFQSDTWKKCYEVLKPGGYLLAFGGSRTFHRIACAIEDAGFEIRDTIMYLYGSGFPKSQNIGKQLEKRLEDEKTKQKTEHDLRLMWERDLQKTKRDEKKQDEVLQSQLQEQSLQVSGKTTSDVWREQSSMERWNNIQKTERELQRCKVCEMSKRVSINGEERWICNGTQISDGKTLRKMLEQSGSCSSYRPQSEQQQDRKLNAIQEQCRTQESREVIEYWNGWGTALKPSYESIIIAQKPYSIEIYLLIGILDILNEVIDKCQLNLNANIVEKISKLNQAKQSVEENIVLNNAESKMFTKEDLLEVMDMLQSTLTENTNLNTELLCLNFLVEICNQMSKYTTETKINLITELKILKLLVVENILKNTMEENKIKQLGMKQNALTVEEFLKEEKLKLNYINILSAQDNAILKEEESSLHPKLNQIIVARKPFKGSLVDNVIEYGVGGINIDECRVEPTNEVLSRKINKSNNEIYGKYNNFGNENNISDSLGRFPANTILTYDETDFDEVCGGFPNTKTGNIKPYKRNMKNQICYGNLGKNVTSNHIGDSGSASRYFYNAKASKKDRDEGLDNQRKQKVNDGRQTPIDNPFQRGETPRRNVHPTVKPTNLMQYLVRLVTPNNGIILDPFNGSGSTGKAVMYENKERNKNYKYIGIELTEEYLPIAKARIEYVCKLTEEEKNKERQMSIYDL